METETVDSHYLPDSVHNFSSSNRSSHYKMNNDPNYFVVRETPLVRRNPTEVSILLEIKEYFLGLRKF